MPLFSTMMTRLLADRISDISSDYVGVVLDREQGGEQELEAIGKELHSLIPLASKGIYWLKGDMSSDEYGLVRDYQENEAKYQTLDAIAACKVFVMTSLREGLPTVLLEAMSMEKACVVPDAPWFNDAIPSQEYGLKYKQGDLEDLARKIEIAMAARPNEAARRFVETSFSWPVIMKQLDRIYRELLG